MPELIRLYLKNIALGFALAVAFVGLLMWFNVANLWHLISTSDIGYIAVALLVVFNTIVFAGVQFAIAIMRMAEDETPPGGGKRDVIHAQAAVELIPVRVPVDPQARTRQRR